MSEYNWVSCAKRLPPAGVPVMTKIDDKDGVRNEQQLKLVTTPSSWLWFFPDDSMYVYYTPTHWAEVTK